MSVLRRYLLGTTRIPRDLPPQKPLWAIRSLWESRWEREATFAEILRASVNQRWTPQPTFAEPLS